MNKKIKILSTVVASFAFAALAKANNPSLVNTLVKKGYITQEEAATVSKSASMASPSGAMHTSSITFGGLVQTQYDFIHVSTDATSNSATVENDHRRSAGFSLRNLKLGMNAQLSDSWSASVAVANVDKNDAADQASTIQVDTAVVNWKAMDELELGFGYDTPAFGLENCVAASETKTLETSAAGRFFDQGLGLGNTNTGVFAKGQFLDGFYYNAAITNTTGKPDSSIFSQTTNIPAFYGRLGYTHILNDVHMDVGIDGAWLQGDRPRYQDALDRARRTIAGSVYAKANYKDFSLGLNFMAASIRDGKERGRSATPWGLVAIPSYKFMDGRYEIVGMYSYLNLGKLNLESSLRDDSAILGNTNRMGTIIRNLNQASANRVYLPFNAFHQFYVGGNWYIIGNDVKLTAGYTFTYAKDLSGFPRNNITRSSSSSAKINHFGARLQLLF